MHGSHEGDEHKKSEDARAYLSILGVLILSFIIVEKKGARLHQSCSSQVEANVLGLKRLQNKTTSTFPLPTLGTPSPLHTTCGVEEPASVVVPTGS